MVKNCYQNGVPDVSRSHHKTPENIPREALQECDEWSCKQAIRLFWLTDFAQKFKLRLSSTPGRILCPLGGHIPYFLSTTRHWTE
ncbi:hypothetical protein NHQ30_005213 [Ciborinia camelliae]|nr:hypothetical protein NHQ30_005213 [Ciborinia camelliae]